MVFIPKEQISSILLRSNSLGKREWREESPFYNVLSFFWRHLSYPWRKGNNVVSARETCCKNKQLHVIQSKELAGVFSNMANTRKSLKETNEFSSILVC